MDPITAGLAAGAALVAAGLTNIATQAVQDTCDGLKGGSQLPVSADHGWEMIAVSMRRLVRR